jgi:glycosyltransferase involved in cell wall biosynthesis
VIRFISNLPATLITGGFSAMNAAAYATLADRFEVTYAGPINPPSRLLEMGLSKTSKALGLKRDFYAFSRERLASIAAAVEASVVPGARLDFFHGFTPWISTRPRRPYVAWSDCAYCDYIEIFHARSAFRDADIDRIERAEAAWLRSADRVLFTSEWAAERTRRRYDLDSRKVASVGLFGEVEPSDHALPAAGAQFAFISTDFVAKGGPVVLEAFEIVRGRHASARLAIIGAAPPDTPNRPGVEYLGFLRKEVAEDSRRFREMLGQSAALVHPTRGDIAPLLLIEAASLGCPAIASRAFAIPEIIEDGRTGLLLDNPADAAEVARAMNWVIEHPHESAAMREAAWRRARTSFGKPDFAARLVAEVEPLLAESEPAPP